MKKILLFFIAAVFAFASKAQQTDVSFAKRLVLENSKAIGLSDADKKDLRVSNAYSNDGIQMVYLLQDFNSLPIYNQMKVLAFRNNELISNAGEFLPDVASLPKNSTGTPSISATAAIAFAFHSAGVATPASFKVPSSSDNGRRLNYGILPGVTEDVKTELLWVPMQNGTATSLRLAWMVQVVPANSTEYWMIQVDAMNGSIINKVNLTVHDKWERPGTLLKARPQTGTNTATGVALNLNTQKPYSPEVVNNATYTVVPFPAPGPNAPNGTPTSVSNPWTAAPGNATTLKWHSNGTTDWIITRGNNVWATEDHAATNQNTGQPATSTTPADPLAFDFVPNFNAAPNSGTNQNFNITDLFYWNNIMHDVSYMYGFNEVSGNFQDNNQGRGGQGGDEVIGLCQSGAGTNNADFSTPADGGRGRMRMYLFNAVANVVFHVNTPASLAGNYTAVEGGMSTANLLANVGPVTAPVAYFNDDASGTTHLACVAGVGSLAGKIAFIYRGTCNFTAKVKAAQDLGAVGVIMVNNVAGAPIVMGGTDNTITIPAVMISDVDGATLAPAVGTTLNVTLSGSAGQQLDGDADPDVMCHEFTHGISNRLTGGGSGSCLGNAEEGGEGWSDYVSMMVTTNWATAGLNDGALAHPVGTYVVGQPYTGAGIRLYPYSTNLTIDPLTYANMGTGTVGTEVHNIGEIWCVTLWEMTWDIIQQQNSINPNMYNFDVTTTTGGNSIALKLVLEGMRLQPCQPGYIDARDAILKADRNIYCGAHACSIWTAFAKRGMGFGSSQGSSNSATDQTSTTTMPPAPTIATQPQSVSVASGANAVFTVAAGGNINLIYQWQVSTDGGTTWTDISCQIASTLTLTNVQSSMNGYQYRAKVYYACLSTLTNAATLTVTGGASNPVITTQPANASACAGSNASFTVAATGTALTYQWQVSTNSGGTWTYIAGATTATLSLTGVTVGMNGNQYRVIVTSSGTLNTTSNAATLTVTAIPSAPTVTSPINYCQNAAATALTATGTNLLWYTAATGGTGSATAPTPSTTTVGSTTYYVSQTTATCESPRASITVNVTATPAAPTVTTPVNYCQNSAATPLTATGTNLLWYTAATGGVGSSTAPTPSTATIGSTTYYVSQTTGTCESPRAAIVVNVTASTPAPGVTSPVAYCQNATASPLTATGTSLLWYTAAAGGVGSSTAPTPSTTTVGSTTYYVSQTTSCGEGPRAAIVVNVTAPPSAPAVTSPVVYCQNATASPLTATGSGLLWYTAAAGGTGSSTAPTPSTATVGSTTYYVSQTVGCESPRAAITVTVNAIPAAPTATSPVNYCQNAAATPLTATGSNLLWYTVATGGTGSSTAPTPSTATVGSTTYYVSKSSASCESPRTAIVVNVAAATTAPTVVSPVAYCQGATAAQLTATGTSLLWYTAAAGGVGSSTAPTPSTATAGSTNYYVSQSGGCGEGPRAVITVTVTALPAAPTVTTPVVYCQNATATALSATGTNLLWYTAATGGTGSATAPTPSTSTVGSTTYYVSQTPASCEGPRAAIVVTVNATPGAPTATTPVNYCQGSAAVPLSATGTNLHWYTVSSGGTGSTTAPTPSTATVGSVTYYVSQTTGACEGPRTAIVVNTTVGASITTQPVDIVSCATSASFSVTATGTNLTYQWQVSTDGGVTYTNIPGATASTVTIPNLTQAQSNYKYRVIVSAAGCGSVTSNSATAHIGNPPSVVLTAAPTTAYNPSVNGGLFATVSPVGNYNYQWTRNGVVLPATGSSITAANGLLYDFGTYVVTVTDATSGCSGVSNPVTITDIIGGRTHLFVSPNPTSGLVHVSYYSETTDPVVRQITVYDGKGARVMNAEITVSGRYGNADLDLTKMVSGTYMIVLSDAAGKHIANSTVVKY